MTLDPQHEAAFAEYAAPLRLLEHAFVKAGLPISFLCQDVPPGNKVIQITRNKKVVKVICIEGDSPAQAIKDVATAVRL